MLEEQVTVAELVRRIVAIAERLEAHVSGPPPVPPQRSGRR